MQEVFVYIVLALALIFLARKYFFNKKKNNGCDPNCDC